MAYVRFKPICNCGYIANFSIPILICNGEIIYNKEEIDIYERK